MPELIKASTFTRLKRLAPRSVRRMLQDRGMPGKKRGTTRYVKPAAAAEWLTQHSQRTTACEKGPKVRAKSPRKRPRPEQPPAGHAESIDHHIVRLDHILAAFIGTLRDGQFDARAVTGIKQVSAELRMLERHRVEMREREDQLVPKDRHERVVATLARTVFEEIQAFASTLPEAMMAVLVDAGLKVDEGTMRLLAAQAGSQTESLRTRTADGIEASDV